MSHVLSSSTQFANGANSSHRLRDYSLMFAQVFAPVCVVYAGFTSCSLPDFRNPAPLQIFCANGAVRLVCTSIIALVAATCLDCERFAQPHLLCYFIIETVADGDYMVAVSLDCYDDLDRCNWWDVFEFLLASVNHRKFMEHTQMFTGRHDIGVSSNIRIFFGHTKARPYHDLEFFIGTCQL